MLGTQHPNNRSSRKREQKEGIIDENKKQPKEHSRREGLGILNSKGSPVTHNTMKINAQQNTSVKFWNSRTENHSTLIPAGCLAARVLLGASLRASNRVPGRTTAHAPLPAVPGSPFSLLCRNSSRLLPFSVSRRSLPFW